MRPVILPLAALFALAPLSLAQDTQIRFQGDFRLGHVVQLVNTSPTAYAFLDALSFAQAPVATWTPFGTYHLDLVHSSVHPVAASNNEGTLSLHLPPIPSLVGMRVFAQGLGFNSDLSPVSDFVVCSLQEDLTERNADQWFAGADDETSVGTTTDDATVHAVGATSLRWDTTAPYTAHVRFPANRSANWNISGNTHLEFFVRAQNPNIAFQDPQPVVRIGNDEMTWIEYRPSTDLLTPINHLNGWTLIRVPLAGDSQWTRIDHGFTNLVIANWIEIAADTWDAGFTLWIDGLCFTPVGTDRPFAPSVQESDLDVTHIERLPRYLRYDVRYDTVTGNPYLEPGTETEKRWPDPGEPVVFRARIKNAGRRDTGTFQVFWTVDGVRIATHTQPSLLPGAQCIDELPWHWQTGSHSVSCIVESIDLRREVTELNNGHALATDALTFGFTMAQATYDALNSVPNLWGSFSAEDWLNGQLAWMNAMFVDSNYLPFAPVGSLQRVRMDKLTVVPTVGSVPTDREVDGQWRFPATSTQEYVNHSTRPARALLHELTHQLGIIDLYQMNLEPWNNLVDGRGFVQANPGLMGGGTIESHTNGLFYASHDVFGLNATLGYRRGHYGEYLYLLPGTVTIELRDGATILTGVPVRLFQRDKLTSQVDAIPEITGTSDGFGRLVLPNRTVVPVTTATGATLAPNPWGQVDVVGRNGLFLVEAATPSGLRYGFFTIQDANLEYARGNTASCVLVVQLVP